MPRARRPTAQPLVLLLVLLAACTEAPGGPVAGAAAASGRGPTYVRAEDASLAEIRDEVEAIGTARANESVIIAAKVTDTVSRVNFDDGDIVEAGAVLVELTNTEQSALLDEAEANVKDAGNQARRLTKLAADNSIPLSQLDEARARLDAAEARYQSIVARLEDRLIRAPFAGLLGFREVSEGTLLTPGSRITTLDDIATIKLDFSVPEVYLDLVHPGLELSAQSSAYPDHRFQARVRTIGSRVDEVTRSAVVRAHIDNADLLLKPGMLLTVHLTTARREALLVPETAIVQRSSQMYVYTIQDGRAAMRQVRTGVRRAGRIEVTGGLTAGEPVITEGTIKIRDGSPVTTELPAAGTGHADPGGSG